MTSLVGGRSILTLNQGGRAFKVTFNASRFAVYEMDERCSSRSTPYAAKCFTRLVFAMPHKRALVGRGSVLFEVADGNYVIACEELSMFKPGERIEKYCSPHDGSGGSLPIAHGKKAVYMPLERVAVPKSPAAADPRALFSELSNKEWESFRKAHRLPGFKVLRQRPYY